MSSEELRQILSSLAGENSQFALWKPIEIRELEIPDVKLVVPKRLSDVRGHFSEIWSEYQFRKQIANVTFVQDNQSTSVKKGTLRGLHFQRPPRAQGKLVQVIRGSIFDVVVDIRRGSPTYRRHVVTRLDALVGAQLWVPPGFLHGFCTLEDETVVFYKVTTYYGPDHDAGVLWNDPDLGIEWPVDNNCIVLSEKAMGHICPPAGRVASPRRPRFCMTCPGAPVRSEIGPYQALTAGTS